jgi:PAS domain-containing protein
MLFLNSFVKRESVSQRFSGVLFSISAGIFLLYLLNPLHGLFYHEATYRFIGGNRGFSSLYMKKGPLFYVLYFYYASFLYYAARQLFGALRASGLKSDKRRYKLLIIYFASMVPGLIWLLFGLDRILDPTPLFFVLIGSSSLWGEGKCDLMRTQVTRWENMFIDSSEPAFLLMGNSEFISVNKEAVKLTAGEAYDPHGFLKLLEKAISTQSPIGFPSGNPMRWLDVRKSVFDAYRGLVHYQLTDVTDKRYQHKLLRASEEQYRLLITQMQQGLAVFDTGGGSDPGEYRCLHGNEAFARSAGFESVCVLPGLTIAEVFPILDDEWREAFVRAARLEDVPRFERYWSSKKRYFGIRIYSPLPGQVAVILSDITARKAIEQELRTKDKLLVTIIGIANAMLMSVTERFKEIGTMKCLGALSGFIRQMFLIESAVIGVVGSFVGILIGITFPLLLYSFAYGFRNVFTGVDYGNLGVMSLEALLAGTVLSIIAAIYPATIAARMIPAMALRTNV